MKIFSIGIDKFVNNVNAMKCMVFLVAPNKWSPNDTDWVAKDFTGPTVESCNPGKIVDLQARATIA